MIRITLSILVIAASLATACGSGDDDAAGEPVGLEGTTAEHNRIRAAVGVEPMTWDPQLAAIASDWVARCVDLDSPIGLVDHNPDRGLEYPTSVGENIYASSQAGAATGVIATQSWEEEMVDFTYPDQCADNRVCGHYTQIVWRTSDKLGCAVGDCPRLGYRSTVVCNYAPAGNGRGAPY